MKRIVPNQCDKCEETKSEIRKLPVTTQSNIFVCYHCYLDEMEFRQQKIDDGLWTKANTLFPKWEDLEIESHAWVDVPVCFVKSQNFMGDKICYVYINYNKKYTQVAFAHYHEKTKLYDLELNVAESNYTVHNLTKTEMRNEIKSLLGGKVKELF